MSAHLLLVEDDPRIVSFLRRGLEAEGYTVEVAGDGRQGIELANAKAFALIILDRMLPGIDGLAVCKKLRQDGNRSLILMLTAKDALEDKIDGLKGGADDYLTKPFAFGEVLARIEALLRRSAPAEKRSVIEIGDVRIDLAAKTVWRGERKIALTAKEFALLAYLMENAGTPVSREELLSKVWKLNFDPGTKVVEVYIRYLRRKIDDGETEPLIRTVRGFGYTMALPGSSRVRPPHGLV
jgi:two-component system OmpR family response regulator